MRTPHADLRDQEGVDNLVELRSGSGFWRELEEEEQLRVPTRESPGWIQSTRETLGHSDGGRRKRSVDLKGTIDCPKEGVSGRKSTAEVLRGGGKGLQGMPKVGYTIGAGEIAGSRPEAGPLVVFPWVNPFRLCPSEIALVGAEPVMSMISAIP